MSWYLKVENAITRMLILALVGIVFMEVIMRALSSPTSWSVGVAQLIFIWLIFIGSNQALRHNAHVGVDVITQLLPVKVQKVIEFIMFLLIILFLIVLIIFGGMMVYLNTGRIIGGTSIAYYFITLSIPIGSLLMLGTAIQKVRFLYKQLKDRLEEKGEEVST
ncbi:TRAP transporter small permease [Shouchella clausii]|uniref:TRAP transporter small permease n=1 Tax=Shouchella clausii TaxID=79880 RepID=UPI0015CBE5D0|nr:TRAP transporter small permease subunit [Shouchella clausii]